MTVGLPKPLRRECWLPFYGSIGYLLYANLILGPYRQWLFGTWITLLSILVLKYSKLGKLHVNIRLPKPLPRVGLLPYYGSLASLLHAHPIPGPITSRATWYMDHISILMRADIFAIGQSSHDYQTIWVTASWALILILWKHRVFSIRTSNLGPIAHGLLGILTKFLLLCAWNIGNWAKFVWLSDSLHHCVTKAACHLIKA